MLKAILAIIMAITLNGQAKSDAFAIIWSQNIDVTTFGSYNTTIDGGNLYSSNKDSAFCLDKSSGRILWTNKMTNFFYRNTTPVVYNDKVIYNGGTIICLSKNNGDLIWKMDMSVMSEPIRITNRYYFLNNRKKLVLLDLDKAETIEEWPLDEPVLNMSIIDDDAIFTDFNKGQVSRYNLSTKKYLWKKDVNKFRITTSLVHENRMFIANNGNTKCISLANGDLLWETTHRGGSFYPVIYNNKLFVGATCINPLIGELIWDYGCSYCNSAVINDRLYVFSSWDLTIHNINNGDKIWSENVSSALGVGPRWYTRPIVSDDRIYITSDGSIYCYGKMCDRTSFSLGENEYSYGDNKVYFNVAPFVSKDDNKIYIDAINVLGELGIKVWYANEDYYYCTRKNATIATLIGRGMKKEHESYVSAYITRIDNRIMISLDDLRKISKCRIVYDNAQKKYLITAGDNV